MATIHVDGNDFEVDGADNLLQACLSLGLDIPYFCWHPALGSVGACRQCAVKQYSDENDTRGRIVMSCMTPATDNTWISIDDEESKAKLAAQVQLLASSREQAEATAAATQAEREAAPVPAVVDWGLFVTL